MKPCISCRTVVGELLPPGGILYEGDHWIFCLREKPLLVAGQGFIVLKRHCETMTELSLAEAVELGVVMQRVSVALTEVVGAEKVHFGLYAEEVKHLHVHVTPRTKNLPAGNIPLTLLSLWYGWLAKIRVRKGIPPSDLLPVAEDLKSKLAPR